jgi:hypothetical protein
VEEEFDDIWYATPDLIHSHLRWSVKRDSGSLVARRAGVDFLGAKQRLGMVEPKSIIIVRSSIPWNQLMLGVAPFMFLAAAAFVGSGDFSLVLQFLGLITVTLVIGAIASRGKWIEIAFLDETGQRQHAYFTYGYSHLFDRGSAVEELCGQLSRIVFSKPGEQDGNEGAEPAPFWHGNIVRICDKCGNATVFKARDRGKVQRCETCGAYIDVPDIGEQEEDEKGEGS